MRLRVADAHCIATECRPFPDDLLAAGSYAELQHKFGRARTFDGQDCAERGMHHKETIMQTAVKTIGFSKGMRDGVVYELMAMLKSKILLMLNPNKGLTVEGPVLVVGG